MPRKGSVFKKVAGRSTAQVKLLKLATIAELAMQPIDQDMQSFLDMTEQTIRQEDSQRLNVDFLNSGDFESTVEEVGLEGGMLVAWKVSDRSHRISRGLFRTNVGVCDGRTRHE